MKIACITRHYYPTDREIRITKFATVLEEAGNDVCILCPGKTSGDKEETVEHGRVIRFKPLFGGFLGRLLFSPLPINPIWFLWFMFQYRKESLDIIIIRDLRLALPAIIVAKLMRKKSILDIGENYPGMMKIVGKQRFSHYFIRNIFLIRILEAISVFLADRVWVVVEENRKRLLRYTKEINIEVISNYSTFTHDNQDCIDYSPYSDTGEPIKLIFLGVVTEVRGLDLAIDAYALLQKDLKNVELHIYGDGSYLSTLVKQAKKLGLNKTIQFHGWVDNSQKNEVLKKGDIGLLLHKKCDLTETTIPNKLFDYMMVGLPIVATPVGPIARVIDDADCGVVIAEEDSLILAKEIKKLVLYDKKREKLGRNGVKAILSKYSWNAESQKLLKNIHTLLSE